MTPSRRHPILVLLAALWIPLPAANALAAAEQPEAMVHRAYFLENVAGDYAAAKELYTRSQNAGLPDELHDVARVGAERCRDRIAAADFSTLMPPDSLVYVELRRPGQLIGAITDMLGMTPESMRSLLDARPDSATGGPAYIPRRIAISPALIDAFSAFGGAAVGLTDIDFEGDRPPSGLLVIHHGDVKLMKGLIETAFQFAPTAEKIAALPTFQSTVPDLGGVMGVLTEGLLIVGNDRALIEGAVGRLTGTIDESLRRRDDLREVFEERGDRAAFAFGDLSAIYGVVKKRIGEHDRNDLAVANSFLDLEHLRWATFTFGADSGALGVTARVCYADDHRSIVYNMMRLPPLSRASLKYVPADAAAVIGLGLNPALASIAAGRAEEADGVTGMDIPREIFGNIREICGFVIPGPAGHTLDGRDPIPNAGIVIASNDIARSRVLWHELLRIPGLAVESGAVEPKTIEIDGTNVSSYFIPELGNVYVAEIDNCLTVGLTRKAIAAVVAAHRREKSILDDEAMGPAFVRLPESAGMILVGHVGRLSQVGGGMGEPELVAFATPASKLCRNTTFWLGVGQSRTQLTLTGALTGLPNVNEALAMFGPMLHGASMSADESTEHVRAPNRASVPEPVAR